MKMLLAGKPICPKTNRANPFAAHSPMNTEPQTAASVAAEHLPLFLGFRYAFFYRLLYQSRTCSQSCLFALSSFTWSPVLTFAILIVDVSLCRRFLSQHWSFPLMLMWLGGCIGLRHSFTLCFFFLISSFMGNFWAFLSLFPLHFLLFLGSLCARTVDLFLRRREKVSWVMRLRFLWRRLSRVDRSLMPWVLFPITECWRCRKPWRYRKPGIF